MASVPNFNLIRWKKTMPQWWEPAEIHCLSQAEPRPQPCGGLRWRRAWSQPCRCLGKWGAGLLLRPAAGNSHVAFTEATLTPMCKAVGSTEALLYMGPVTSPFKTLRFHPDGKSGVGIQLQPKGSKSLYEIFPSGPPKVCNMAL